MNRTRSWMCCSLFALTLAAVVARAQVTSHPDAVGMSSRTNSQPGKSPVETFRKILSMSPVEREQFLTNYPVATRGKIMAKVEEYQILPGPFRELRLRTTELRWYLLPLLKVPPTNRVERLKEIPEPYQKLVAARLEEWDIWPPSLKEEILEYEDIMDHFVGWGAPAPSSSQPRMKTSEPERRWQALPAAQRDQIYASFRQYFELNEEEKQKTLDALSEPERQQAEKVLDPIEKWSRTQQEKYLTVFQQFANMTIGQRQRFLQNAERWQKMPETERQAWRDLIKQLSGTPPLPMDVAPTGDRPAGSGFSMPVRTNPTSAPVR